MNIFELPFCCIIWLLTKNMYHMWWNQIQLLKIEKNILLFLCVSFLMDVLFHSAHLCLISKIKKKKTNVYNFVLSRFLSKNKTMSEIPKGIEIPGRQHVLFTSFALCIFEHITMIVWDKCKYFQSVLFW